MLGLKASLKKFKKAKITKKFYNNSEIKPEINDDDDGSEYMSSTHKTLTRYWKN